MDIEGQGQQPTTNDGGSSAECLPFSWLRNMDIGGQQLDGGGSVEKIRDNKDNPTKKFLQKWNVIFLLSCVIAVSLDPLFFYLPVINQDKKCLRLQKKFWTTTIALRSVNDIIKLLHIILQFCTGFIDEKLQKSGRVGKDEWNKNAWDIARRRSYFVVDILAILPIPQVIMSSIFSVMSSTKSSNTLKLLNSVVLFQYVPRVVQIYQSWKELRRDKKFDKTIWLKAALNFFLYVLAGHVLGAFWYFFSTQRLTACWHISCENHIGCVRNSFNCDHSLENHSFLNDLCPITTENTTLFDFGIFFQALQSGVVESTDIPQKILYCFWWGMQNLSSLGQNLRTSNYMWENCFALCISTSGLLLFLYFIGNLQIYMQLKTSRSEEVRIKMKSKKRRKQKEKIDRWCSTHNVSRKMRSVIVDDVNGRFKEDEDVYLENLLPNLPGNFQSEVKQHICLKRLKKVKVLKGMSEHILVKICDASKLVFYDEHSYIVREGDPIDAIFFITKGIAWTYTTSNKGERTVLKRLVEGQFFGGELLEWVVKSKNTNTWDDLSEFPVSSKTLKTHTKVEAFALMAYDLEKILSNSMLLQLQPEQLDDMAASILQAAWRRRRDASKILQNPAVPVAVKSKNKRPSIVQRAWRGNHRKMDDSVGASSQLQSNNSI